MVLWKKESVAADACYIDLLPHDQLNRSMFACFKSAYGNIQKNEAVSNEMRKQGNELFQAKNWTEAIEQYNKSIRFAINGSENLGLGYANRAACFLHLKMYDKCLVDIELAKKSNYPDRLMHKLDKRKADCLEEIKESTEINKKWVPELSYSTNPKFPGMADILEVQSNAEYGKHIVAKCEIEIGKIVLLEDAFAFGINSDCEIVCRTCAQHVTNFIPCPNCADAMFCNAYCMESNKMHEKICGALYNRLPTDMLTLETILIAVSAFPNAESLMIFVESALATRDLDSPDCETDLQMKYRLFLKLFTIHEDIETVKPRIFHTYKFLLEIPFIEQFFHSEQAKRFLMHLIWQHMRISVTNGFCSSHPKTGARLVSRIGVCMKLFNRSCVPNILHLFCGNKMIAIVQRPVKKGEQLFINYYRQNEDVQEKAQTAHNFRCKCSRCIPCWKQEDRVRIQSDRDYSFFDNVGNSDFADPKQRSVFMSKFKNLLSKYGRLPWSPEFSIIENGFAICYKEELSTRDRLGSQFFVD